MAQLLRGAPVAAAIMSDVSGRAGALGERGIAPTLAILRVGERADDLAYERGAVKRADAAGIAVRRFVLPEGCSQDALMRAIDAINRDASIHGCLMMRPLPKQLDEAAATSALAVTKDVDGVTPGSLYGVFAHEPVGFAPCTAEAVLEMLDHVGAELAGARATVVGRSLVVGRPVALLLEARHATVTLCHSRTRDLPGACRAADIVVVAAGHPGTVDASCAARGQTVIDVGMNWDEDAQRLVGDALFDEVEPCVSAITPVPGGVGAVTTAVLMRHVIEAAERAGSRS